MATRLYGLIWKWHFAIGLIACPLVAIVALTGAIYAFQPELERWAAPELHFVDRAAPHADRAVPQVDRAAPHVDRAAPQVDRAEPHLDRAAPHVDRATPHVDRAEPHDVARARPRRIDDLIAHAKTACDVTSIFIPGPNDRAYTFYCRDDRQLAIDPYRGVILGDPASTATAKIIAVSFALHWEMMLGEKGRLLVEWASSWTILLLVSGAILWWPRGKRRGGGVLYPRAKLVGRQWLRDLHAVVGAYALPVVLVLAATGLMWTIHAGDARWNRVAGEGEHAPIKSRVVDGGQRIGVDAALAAAGLDPMTESRSIDVGVLGDKDNADEPYWFYLRHEDHYAPAQIESGLVDAYSGTVIQREGWNDRKGVLATIDQARYSLHVGAILGLPGRIAACIGSLMLAALCLTGPWMWWKRRPKGTLGVPPAARTPRIFYIVIAALGWLLPMVGYTLLAALAIEGVRWLVVRNREATAV